MIKAFKISNQIGDSVTLIDLGARLISWKTIVEGDERDIVVGYSNASDYYNDACYVGAIAGPYANRIKNAQADLLGKTIKLNANEGSNQLHGGKNALDACVWQIKEQSERAITFKYWLEDGFNGFPGAMTFEVEYRLAETSSQLKIHFNITSEKDTIVGPTGHAYFNLTGDATNINEHKLQLNSEKYTDIDAENIPTGSMLATKDSQFDFSNEKPIGTTEIDHNFVVHNSDQVAATLTSPCGKLSMDVKSDYPGIQVYTADYLAGELMPRQGICLEPQFFPDSPNKPQFPFEPLLANSKFNKKIVYKLNK